MFTLNYSISHSSVEGGNRQIEKIRRTKYFIISTSHFCLLCSSMKAIDMTFSVSKIFPFKPVSLIADYFRNP